MTATADDGKRRKDPSGDPEHTEPLIPDVDPSELEDDQADSGPDRDRQQSGE